MESDTSSQSLGWRGNEADVLLHALTAQVKKLSVSTFMVVDLDVAAGKCVVRKNRIRCRRRKFLLVHTKL